MGESKTVKTVVCRLVSATVPHSETEDPLMEIYLLPTNHEEMNAIMGFLLKKPFFSFEITDNQLVISPIEQKGTIRV